MSINSREIIRKLAEYNPDQPLYLKADEGTIYAFQAESIEQKDGYLMAYMLPVDIDKPGETQEVNETAPEDIKVGVSEDSEVTPEVTESESEEQEETELPQEEIEEPGEKVPQKD